MILKRKTKIQESHTWFRQYNNAILLHIQVTNGSKCVFQFQLKTPCLIIITIYITHKTPAHRGIGSEANTYRDVIHTILIVMVTVFEHVFGSSAEYKYIFYTKRSEAVPRVQ